MKKFITLVSAVAASIIASPSLASDNDHAAHVLLMERLEKVGVTVVVNNPIHCPPGREGGGSYSPFSALLAVCQDNGDSDSVMVKWTPNDYDTLRHESHHVIQDCVSGSIADGRMDMLFNSNDWEQFTKGLDEFVSNVYRNQIRRGMTDKVAMEEVEAYVVAEYVPAASISNKVIEFCLK